MTIYKKLGEKIKRTRLQLGLSQEKLAEDCSLSTSYISCIERGTKKANLEKLYVISNRLNLIMDVYPRKNYFHKTFEIEIFSFLASCSLSEKKFFYNTMRCIISGIQRNKFDW
ncbi:MAG: helix-turn-helix domain-containing protein [Candidatus Gastranaerophilales bacterium]|nr:helix-turn-helix domain-containing protein [Candidatus Gastranaerophilales bacterium]